MPLTSSYRQMLRNAFIGKSGESFGAASLWLGLYSYWNTIPTVNDQLDANVSSGEITVGSHGYSRIPLPKTNDIFTVNQTSISAYVNTPVMFGPLTSPNSWMGSPGSFESWKIRGFALWDNGSGGNMIWYSSPTSGPDWFGFDRQMTVIGPRSPQNEYVVFPVGSLRFEFTSNPRSYAPDGTEWPFKTDISTMAAVQILQAITGAGGSGFWITSMAIGLCAATSIGADATVVTTEADFGGYVRYPMPSNAWERQCSTSLGLYDPTAVPTYGLEILWMNRLPIRWWCSSLPTGCNKHIYGPVLFGFIRGNGSQAEAMTTMYKGISPDWLGMSMGSVDGNAFPYTSLQVGTYTTGVSYSSITINPGSFILII